MAVLRHCVPLGLTLCLVVPTLAADNSKLVDVVLRNHGEAVAKADEVRAKSVDKSRRDAVSQLVKLAMKAYSDKDRGAETNAWKAVLRLDRSHAKAIQYFSDLGTLEKVLAEIKETENDVTGQQAKIVGKWIGHYDNRQTAEFIVNANGTVQYKNERGTVACKLDTDGDAFLVHLPELQGYEKWTIAGNRLFCEHWHPEATFPKESPRHLGYAVRVEAPASKE